MSRFIIYLVEDHIEHAEETIEKLQAFAPEYARDGYVF